MKRILCYGDSNTWGYDPEAYDYATGAFQRLPYEKRWTGILAGAMEGRAQIIEEAFNGRVTVFDDPNRDGRNSLVHFPVSFYSHEPLDLIIISLGTNDTKDVFSAQAGVIGWGMERLIRELRYIIPGSLSKDVKILLMTPPELLPRDDGTFFTGFSQASNDKSRQFPAIYADIARRYNCEFLETQALVQASRIDGIHMNAASHAVLAKAIINKVEEILF